MPKKFDPAAIGFVLTNDQIAFKNLIPEALQAATEFERDRKKAAQEADDEENDSND